MPASVKKIPETGASVLLKKCETCDAAAYFGFGVEYNKALIMLSKGKIDLAKQLLGKWYCYEHRNN